jgi:hypothetical protein
MVPGPTQFHSLTIWAQSGECPLSVIMIVIMKIRGTYASFALHGPLWVHDHVQLRPREVFELGAGTMRSIRGRLIGTRIGTRAVDRYADRHADG